MSIVEKLKKDGASAMGSGNAFGNAKITLGQGVFDGKLVDVSLFTAKNGRTAYKMVFRPSSKYVPEGKEVNDITGYWFREKDDFLKEALNAVNGEKREYTADELEKLVKSGDIIGKCCCVRFRETRKENYGVTEWGYPRYDNFIISSSDREDYEKTFPPKPHLVVDEIKYREQCRIMGVKVLEEKIERAEKASNFDDEPVEKEADACEEKPTGKFADTSEIDDDLPF